MHSLAVTVLKSIIIMIIFELIQEIAMIINPGKPASILYSRRNSIV